jgi:hypothetical protein
LFAQKRSTIFETSRARKREIEDESLHQKHLRVRGAAYSAEDNQRYRMQRIHAILARGTCSDDLNGAFAVERR